MNKGIVVFGSFVVDLTSRQEGLPVPGQTLLGSSFSMGAGGKGSNQAVAAHRAGAEVTLVTKVGNDVFAEVALDFYRKENMRCDFILRDRERETGVALIMVDKATAQNQIVVVSGACGNITPGDVQRCRDLITDARILLVQLEINPDALYSVIDLAYSAGVTVVLNPAPAAPIAAEMYRKLDFITPNETETHTLTGVAVRNEADAKRAADVLHGKGLKNVVITLGERGAFASDGTRTQLLPGFPVQAVDTTGAGDAFNGGFVTALAEGRSLFDAVRYGNATGALSVTKPGTAPSMPTRVEIDALLADKSR